MIKLLVIGDSISVYYRKYLQDYLGDDIKIFSKEGMEEAFKNIDFAVGANNGDSSSVIEYLQTLEKNNIFQYDYCIFNCGLHDIKRYKSVDYALQIDETHYEENLNRIIEILQKNGVQPIFISTTPSYRERYGSDILRKIEDVKKYNKIANKVMTQHDVQTIDLYQFTLSLGLSGDSLFKDHTHFVEEVVKLQAAYIAGAVNMYINK